MKRKWRCICSCASSVEGKDEQWNRFPTYLFLQLSNLRAYPPVNTPWNEQLDCKWRCLFLLNTAIFNHVLLLVGEILHHLGCFLPHRKPGFSNPGSQALGSTRCGAARWAVPMVGEILASTPLGNDHISHIHTKNKGSLETHHLHKCWLVVGHLSFQDIYCLPRRVSLLPQQQTDPLKVLHLSWAQRHPGWSCWGRRCKIVGRNEPKECRFTLLETKTLHLSLDAKNHTRASFLNP